jgi:hypothetical protein
MEDVKAAFKRVALEVHPDRHLGADPEALHQLQVGSVDEWQSVLCKIVQPRLLSQS